MKVNYPKEWFERSAAIEGIAEVGAGVPRRRGVLDLARQPGVPLEQWNDKDAAERERKRREELGASPGPAEAGAPSEGG